ncbi:TRAP transporter substrate-binding protein [Arenibaculum pallidiluteum]|uniref:TRAP transporter substrate-binding protein n=1 Tax=Arenibaculum pallidiluteum TaxID=2812559 RepID=UPI001A9674E7|nr:TRAP transporter substrate-binding protein [Arenibaculum pallidiluteum]
MNRIGVCIAALLAFAAAPALAQQVKLTLGHGAAAGNPRDEGAKKFAELVKEKSGGRIEVQVAGSAQLGDDAAMVTGMRTGSIDMSLNSQGAVTNVVPEYAALGMPYLFDSAEHAWKVVDGPAGDELAKKSEAKGLIVLGYMDNGVRHTSNNKHPIQKPEDLKGLKIRTPPDTVTVSIFRTLGADTQQIKFSELYIALQQGAVDGQENPVTNFYYSKLHEVQPHLAMTGHKYETTPFLMSKRSWDKLGDADRQAIRAAAKEAVRHQRNLALADDKRLIELLPKEGVKITQIDREAFRKATAPVIDEASKGAIGDFVRQVVAEAQKAR